MPDLTTHAPIPTLLSRLRAELSADFLPSRPLRLARAPGRLDVMGGIADYTGSLVCEYPLDRSAAVAIQERDDRQLQVFSFNLFDEHLPFTLRIPLDALADASPADLRREFAEPGRQFAAYLAGCLYLLHEQNYINLKSPPHRGLNLALLSTVPLGAGVSSSAAIEVATMLALAEHFQLAELSPSAATAHPPGSTPSINSEPSTINSSALLLAALCQQVENRIVGAPCGIMDQVTSTLGEPGALLRLLCQPYELLQPLLIPSNMRFVGLNSNVKHATNGRAYARTRCAAFMGHRIILEKMREMGRASGRELHADPMNGYLANLDPDDYKRFFRPYLPNSLTGQEFLSRYHGTIDTATQVQPTETYAIQQAVDHHVLEARRVKQFAQFIEEANAAPKGTREQGLPLDKAGHLMYASHLSYTNDALLGAPECDLLVDLVRSREKAGLYGAKITGAGTGGTVAVLADRTPGADAAIQDVMRVYKQQTGKDPELFSGTSPGAWHTGSVLLKEW